MGDTLILSLDKVRVLQGSQPAIQTLGRRYANGPESGGSCAQPMGVGGGQNRNVLTLVQAPIVCCALNVDDDPMPLPGVVGQRAGPTSSLADRRRDTES